MMMTRVLDKLACILAILIQNQHCAPFCYTQCRSFISFLQFFIYFDLAHTLSMWLVSIDSIGLCFHLTVFFCEQQLSLSLFRGC